MATHKKRIQAYVNDSTYQMLSDTAKSENKSISEVVAEMLMTQSVGSDDESLYIVPTGINSNSDSENITREQLKNILNILRNDILHDVEKMLVDYNARVETHVDTLLSFQQKAFEQSLSTAKPLFDELRQRSK
jgi:predicted CopG family antitoxin